MMKDEHEIMDASNYHNLYSQNMVGCRGCRHYEFFIDIASFFHFSQIILLHLPLHLPLHLLLIPLHFPEPLGLIKKIIKSV